MRGELRVLPEDFRVEEQLGFEPSDEGPHRLLCVEKEGRNTLDVIAEVARAAGVRPRDVGYCGLKDRHAVTRQWLSVPDGDDATAAELAGDGWRVVGLRRNQRKLRLGAHSANRFELCLRNVDGDLSDLDRRLEAVRVGGVPNYFGAQRFGHNGDNLRRARRWFIDGVDLGRRQRRFALSAARSWLFNRVLAARVAAGTWSTPLLGEPMSLDGSRSFFMPEDMDDALLARLASMDVHTSGPLWGRGTPPARHDCAALEADIAASMAWNAEGLAAQGLKQERRALRLAVRDLTSTLDESERTLRLSFTLTRGSFATAVVHELADVEDQRIPA